MRGEDCIDSPVLRLYGATLVKKLDTLRLQAELLRRRNKELKRKVRRCELALVVENSKQAPNETENKKSGDGVFPTADQVVRYAGMQPQKRIPKTTPYINTRSVPSSLPGPVAESLGGPRVAESALHEFTLNITSKHTRPLIYRPDTVQRPDEDQQHAESFSRSECIYKKVYFLLNNLRTFLPHFSPSHGRSGCGYSPHPPVPQLLPFFSSPSISVPLPDIPNSLLQLRLICKTTHGTPAAVSSFLDKLTRTTHTPEGSYRAAFSTALKTLIPFLGPPETPLLAWIIFLNEFPSRIPYTQNDTICISNREPSTSDAAISERVLQPPILGPPPPFPPPPTPSPATHLFRHHPQPPGEASPAILQAPHSYSNVNTHYKSSMPPSVQEAWVLLLALAYAAFPSSPTATKLRRLPLAIKLQMAAWLPPGVNVYSNMHFVTSTINEALEQSWEAKKEILRLRHGWS